VYVQTELIAAGLKLGKRVWVGLGQPRGGAPGLRHLWIHAKQPRERHRCPRGLREPPAQTRESLHEALEAEPGRGIVGIEDPRVGLHVDAEDDRDLGAPAGPIEKAKGGTYGGRLQAHSFHPFN
jgi:hypothetical protein